MTEEDRQTITEFFDRLRNQPSQRDPQAEAVIAQLMNQYPETRYVVTQIALFQEHALMEAQNRIRQLEWELQQKQPGLFGSLFGGNRSGPPPAPVHAPGYRPGMFDRQGSGFLGAAATTAVGVAGGMLLGHAIMSALGAANAQAAEAESASIDSGRHDVAQNDDGDFDGGDDDDFM